MFHQDDKFLRGKNTITNKIFLIVSLRHPFKGKKKLRDLLMTCAIHIFLLNKKDLANNLTRIHSIEFTLMHLATALIQSQ